MGAQKYMNVENPTSVWKMYKINRDKLSHEIVGITSLKLIFYVEFAYLKHEREVNFTRTLEKLKELFTSKKLFPKVMVTDRELSLINSIEVIFQSSIHLL